MCINEEIPTDQYKSNIKLNGTTIQTINEHRFLGVIYDSKFTFKSHLDCVMNRINNRTKAIKCLKGARWGPTQATMLVLYHSYIASVARYGMMAWFPYLEDKLIHKLDVCLRKPIRIALGLPRDTQVEALMLEANVDDSRQLAHKSAASLFCQINPHDPKTTSLAKTHYNSYTPKWATTYLKTLPEVIWSNQLQSNTVKMFMTNDKIQFHEETLNNQNEAESQENKFDWLLYTDASVDLYSEPTGKASIGYIWYKKESGKWRKIVSKSMLLGCMHSSFSAEAIAMTEGLMNQPFQDITADQKSKGVKVGIFTDSLSNIKNLSKGIITAPEQQELAKILQETPIEITIHHTRSHIGITRNEEVDRLCSVTNQDPNRTTIHRDGALTKSKVKEWVKKEMKQLRWQKLYKKRKLTRHQKYSQYLETRKKFPRNINISSTPQKRSTI